MADSDLTTASGWIERYFNLKTKLEHLFVYVDAVHITAESGRSSPTIIVRASSSSILDMIDVVPTPELSAVSISQKSTVGFLVGRCLVEIRVPLHELRSVTRQTSGTLVIHPNVLSRSKETPLSIRCLGSGNIYIHDEEIVAKRLRLHLSASGRVQVIAKSISVVDAVEVQNRASGQLAIVATSLFADAVVIDNSASGKALIVVKSDLHVDKTVNVTSSGSGSATLAANAFVAGDLSIATHASGSTHVAGTTLQLSTVRTLVLAMQFSPAAANVRLIRLQTQALSRGRGQIKVPSLQALQISSVASGLVGPHDNPVGPPLPEYSPQPLPDPSPASFFLVGFVGSSSHNLQLDDMF
ncbi:hypothetical protein Ae201684P_010451 [Aphanomyces euteiches]|nr:hypothetical protein Ae201684P_010451 [Aphanomyces euteiches]